MLPKQNRLKTKYEYNKTRQLGNKSRGMYFYIYYLPSPSGFQSPTRFGVVVSTKFSKIAPLRNRVKRVFREVIRTNFDRIEPGFWIVVHPNHASIEKGYAEILADFNKVIQNLPIARKPGDKDMQV